MSRNRNADEFRSAFQRARGDYDRIFRPRLDEVRTWYDHLSVELRPPDFDESLEYHVRCYVINGLLAALNWRLDVTLEDGIPNLLPEASVRSELSGRRRFLDYLGIEHSTNNPLLVVEAKRPSTPLPFLASLPDIPSTGIKSSPLQGAIPIASDAHSIVISRGLAGESLTGEWSHWLSDLRDYVRSVKAAVGQVPKRVLITNGGWLILFLRPWDAFIEERDCAPETILVFRSPEDIIEASPIVFLQLEHQRVLGDTPALRPVELPFYVESSHIQEAMHGLRVRYEEAQAIYQREPMIYVAPVVFLRTKHGAWLRVEWSATQYYIPHEEDRLAGHLDKVRVAAKSLLAEIANTLKISLVPSSLEKHFADLDAFVAQNAVMKLAEDRYWIVTGEETHYLLPQPSVAECPHHDYVNSHNSGVPALPGPILQRSVEPRSFFYSREVHHCAHQNVALAKSQPVTPDNRARCGLRSGRDGEAFCEIWSFERRLCCRTCAFERVCTKAQSFQLPCQHLVQIKN